MTDANGYYLFTGLISGTYSVTAELPAGYVSSTPDETDQMQTSTSTTTALGRAAAS